VESDKRLAGVFLTMAAKLLQGFSSSLSSSSEPVLISNLNALIDQGGITNGDVTMVLQAGSDLDASVLAVNGTCIWQSTGHSPTDSSLATSLTNSKCKLSINHL
jgi:hypothetical protein